MLLLILKPPTLLHKAPLDMPQGCAPPSETVMYPLALARYGGDDAVRRRA
jgi:biopolymer transport protein ExbD